MGKVTLDEDELLHLQRLAMVGQLSATYAHEINNLLTGVLGYSSLVRRMVDDRPALARDVDRIREQSGRIAQLAQHLLDLSRRDAGAMECLDLAALLDRLLALREQQFRRQRVEIARLYEADLPRVEIIPGEIEQVVVNLLNNALQAMPQGGRLEVRLYRDQDPGFVCLEVTDSGCGIPAAVLPRLFQPFFTTKCRGSGTGLGLYVSQTIVQRHVGSIAIQSEDGRGTTVRVVLPQTHPRQWQAEQENQDAAFLRR
ncbi:MAG: hypothetical protein GX605_04205 [Chloroflexi bacterium]|nr:hypothetical protein [Chloroflexota bacterium]